MSTKYGIVNDQLIKDIFLHTRRPTENITRFGLKPIDEKMWGNKLRRFAHVKKQHGNHDNIEIE